MRVKRATQYVVMAPYEPARMARVTGTIADSGVDLGGIAMARAGESLELKFLVKTRNGLKAKLESKGVRVHETSVLVLEGDPSTEALDRAAGALAARGFNVLACRRHLEAGRSSWVLSVERVEEAAAVLETLLEQRPRQASASAA